jgi:hypothetical protein
VALISRASVGSHCLQSFASNARFVRYSLLRNNAAFFIRFVKTVPVSFVDCTLWAFAPLLGRPVEALHHEHVQPSVEQ